MIKYVLNFEEIYVGLQEELKKWTYELDMSSLKVAHVEFNKNSYQQTIEFNKGVQIKKILIQLTNSSEVKETDKITFLTNKSKIEYNIQKVRNISILENASLQLEKNQPFSLNIFPDFSGDYKVNIYIIYTEEVETQFYFINMRCFYQKDVGVQEELGIKTRIVPYTTKTIPAPKILGYEAKTPELSLELAEEKSIFLDVEYIFKQSFGQPTILYYLLKNNKETDFLLMKKIVGDVPFGVFIYELEEYILDGKFKSHHPTEIAESIDYANRKPIYKVFYEEVLNV